MKRHSSGLWHSAIKYAILFVAVALIALGLWQGEAGEVLQKAVHICLECIGVG